MAKPHPPRVNLQRLSEITKGDQSIEAMRARFEQYEKLREARLLPTTYISLEALASLSCARITGHSEEELVSTWPSAWGPATLSVPVSLLQVLAGAWAKYLQAESGVTLGEAFGLEGGGQGAAPVKRKQRTRDARRGIANKAVALYIAQGTAKQPRSWEWICGKIADEEGCSVEQVETALETYRKEIFGALSRAGLTGDPG